MKSGYARNVSNFETVTVILSGLGEAYAPDQPLITLDALRQKHQEALSSLNEVDRRQAEKAVAIDARLDAFKNLELYFGNIVRAARVIVDDNEFTESVRLIAKRIRSRPANGNGNAPEDENPAPARSPKANAQRSFGDRIEILSDLLALLQTRQEEYRTADPEYSIDGIAARLASMRATDNAAKNATSALSSALESRNRHLFDSGNGIIKLVSMIKAYLIIRPGRESSAYRQIRSMNFLKA